MAQQKTDPANYYLSAAGAAAFWSLRINDVTVWRDFNGQDTNFTLPVNAYLQSGRNEITVTFVSVAGDPYEFNVATPDFYFLTEIERLDLKTRDTRRATLLNLTLDEKNDIQSPAETRFGLPVQIATQPPMLVAGGGYDRQELADGWGSTWTARRAMAVFELADELPELPWAKAPVLSDTPELRASLLDAYRELHAALSSGDRDRIRQLYEPAWRQIAASMNYASVDEFIEKTSALEQLGPVDPQGMRLQPLDLVLGERDFVIEFMAGKRLIRIVPDPILWAAADDPDNVQSSNVAFFMGSDKRLHVGAVLY
ncbi:hypothetical protein F8A10_03480 [Paracoccus kondratievae]|uniref:hypothetical protein n=1 Tax=Paracoccus kondratievae TaxID=135740 RepID=UPI00126688F9|nr:hypothetical protein [Paracoccus kondratievae]QFQ86581.1 hypothetical protein F8A10_03480 [Paracoccus kondratievae]